MYAASREMLANTRGEDRRGAASSRDASRDARSADRRRGERRIRKGDSRRNGNEMEEGGAGGEEESETFYERGLPPGRPALLRLTGDRFASRRFRLDVGNRSRGSQPRGEKP